MGLTRAKIAIDAMGGDHAPNEIVAGSLRAAKELDVDILLVGDPHQLEPLVRQHNSPSSVEIVPAEEVISMHDEPLTGIRKKPKASINVAMKLVKKQRAQAVISAGHSGAAMAAALLRLGRLPGIERPAIGALFPTLKVGKSVIILDVGANVDSRPKFLEQFALMGTVYSQYVLGVEKPAVGLLNIGEESSKGNDLALKTHQLLKDNEQIPFRGNAEGRDVLSGEFDVIVCDGFVGNVLLKFAESIGEVMLQILREELPRGVQGKIGTTLLKPNLKRIKQRIDHAEHGGALLLGVNGISIIGHGSSKAPSIFNAIRLAKDAIDNEVLDRIRSSHTHLKTKTEDERPPAQTASSNQSASDS